MRLFTAIDIPAELKDSLGSFLKRLRPTAQIAWSSVDNLHVTTKFIGEWPEQRLDEMKQVLTPVKGAVEIGIQGVGWFPDQRRPRVLWAGINGGEPLRTLANATEQAVASLGVPVEERVYAPHITLARIRGAASLDLLREALDALPNGCGFDFGSFRATQFFLYLSAGGRYAQLAGFPLE